MPIRQYFAAIRRKPGISERLGQVGDVEVGLLVPFASEGEHGVGTALDAAVDHAGEVHAQEGKVGVGHGVDQVLAEMMRLGLELEIFAAKRHDLGGRLFAAHRGDPVAMQARRS